MSTKIQDSDHQQQFILSGQNLVGISFNPTTSLSSGNGELTFGGVDSSKCTGSIAYTPITSAVSAAKYYWGIVREGFAGHLERRRTYSRRTRTRPG